MFQKVKEAKLKELRSNAQGKDDNNPIPSFVTSKAGSQLLSPKDVTIGQGDNIMDRLSKKVERKKKPMKY